MLKTKGNSIILSKWSQNFFGHLKLHFVVPENVQFGKKKHPSLRAAAQSNIYGFITLICFGLSMWIHLSFLQTYFFLNFYTRYNEKKKTYNWFLMIYTLKRRNAATKVVILFLVIQSNTVSYILKMMLMKNTPKWLKWWKCQSGTILTSNLLAFQSPNTPCYDKVTQDTRNFVDMVQQ